jgi:hypothetical protein
MEVKLGQHVLPLVAVSIPRARRGIQRAVDAGGDTFSNLGTDGKSSGEMISAIIGMSEPVLYDLLCTFVPGLRSRMPLYEFAGFASAAALAADEYDEDADMAPSTADIQSTLEAVWEVSQIGRLVGPVASRVDPTVVREIVQGILEDGAKIAASLTTSPSSSGASGLTNGSAPTMAPPVSPSPDPIVSSEVAASS